MSSQRRDRLNVITSYKTSYKTAAVSSPSVSQDLAIEIPAFFQGAFLAQFFGGTLLFFSILKPSLVVICPLVADDLVGIDKK